MIPAVDEQEPSKDGDEGGSAYDPGEIRALVDRLRKQGEAVAQKYRTIAEVNEAFYAGEQWSVAVSTKGKVRVDKNAWFDNEKVPRISVNLFTGLLMTWSALLTSDRPTAKAVPASDDPINTYRAEIAQKYVEYLEEEVDSAGKVMDVVQLAALGGTAGLKIIYQSREDRITWEPVSVHDFLIDPHCPDWRDSGWVIFVDHISKEEAEQTLADYGLPDVEVEERPYKNAANEELHGVERVEAWLRPTRKYPNGLYACFVGDEPIEVTDYPLVVEDDSAAPQYLLPIVLMRVRNQRGSVYGNTNFTDVVPLQRALNESVSRVQKILRTTSAIHLKMPRSLAKGFNPAESSVIEFTDAQAAAAKSIDFTRPPEPSQAIFAQRDFLAAAMEKVIGLNSTSTGSQPSSLSGRAIENLVSIDQERNADCVRSILTMLEEAYHLSLCIVRRFFTMPRQLRITNGDAAMLLAFQGADIEGVDIRLEPASEIDDLSTRKEQIAVERTNAGVAGPLALPDAQNNATVGRSRAVAEQIVKAWMNGQPVADLPDDINFDAVDDVINRYKASALSTQDMGLWVSMEALRKQIESLKGRADNLTPSQPAQPQPGAPPPAGA